MSVPCECMTLKGKRCGCVRASESAARVYDRLGFFKFRCCDNHLMVLARGNRVKDKWGRTWEGKRCDRGVYAEEVKPDE